MSIRPLAEADASCGAKAFGLARLIAAGLPVPEGFVLEAAVFRETAALGLTEGDAPLAPDPAPLTSDRADAIGHELAAAARRIAEAAPPAELDRELRAVAGTLGRLAVRSSASIEDGELGAAAGVFASVTDVAPGDVWNAIRAVWTSALTPLAVAYARRRGASISIAVILQRFVPGPRVTIYTRPVGGDASDELWVQRGDALERIERSPGRPAGGAGEAAIALAAEAAIGASRGADVELVLEATPQGARPWIVQARPILHPVRPRRRGPPPLLLAPLVQDGRRWTWDIAHNPDPLSPAQAGLVERVDRAGAADDWLPYSLRVCGGYLYAAPRAEQKLPAPPTDRADLAARIAAIEARIAPMVDVPEGAALTVADTIERYVAFMRIWACELSPLVAAARKRLLDRLAREGHAPERIPALAAQLIGPRRVLRDPVMSLAWDIAVPTFAERTDRRRDLAPSGTTVEPMPPPAELAAEVDLARAAADAGERDDLWFARAQWLVRRALLAHATALALRGDDIFWLPLDEVITLRTLDPDDAHRRASAARAAHARAAEWDMPLVVHGDASVGEEAAEAQLRGVGEGPRVVGRVVRLAFLHTEAPTGRAIGPEDIVVTRAITPALAMMVEGCAALVSETGGLLDHGAALARELGIPCVVGCRGAWSSLADGMLVSVDGDAGLVSLA